MKDKCECEGKLEFISATRPKMTNRLFEQEDLEGKEYFYKTERQLFLACERCNSLYDIIERVEFGKTGVRSIIGETSPYLGDLCRTEIEKYAGTKAGVITPEDELEIVKEFASTMNKTK